MSENWYTKENLEKEEKLIREGRLDEGTGGDFVSYKMMKEGKTPTESNIKSHNAIGIAAEATAACVSHILGKRTAETKSVEFKTDSDYKIGDFGGGLGYIANAISKEIPESKIYSYDVSGDAGEYGRKHFPQVQFITGALGVNDVLQDGPFDAIVANEFYPFTRTEDYSYQKAYVDMCLNNLKGGGMLIIGAPQNGGGIKNIFANLDKLRNDYCVSVKLQPYAKIYKFVKFYPIALIISHVFALFRMSHQMIVIEKVNEKNATGNTVLHSKRN